MKSDINYLIKKLDDDNLSVGDIEMINRLLFSFNDKITNPDLILVLASSSIKRIEKAVSLYHKYHVKILISGANYLKKDGMDEYEKYYIYAVCHGVLSKDILLDKKSHNTLENILNSLNIITCNYKNIIVVSSQQHLLRVKLTFEKVLADENISNINLFFVGSYATLVPKDDWFLKDKAIEIILGELKRIINYDLLK